MTKQNTQARPSSLGAPVSAPVCPHSSQRAGAHFYTKVSAVGANFDEAPAGLKPIGGVLAGIIAGLKPE